MSSSSRRFGSGKRRRLCSLLSFPVCPAQERNRAASDLEDLGFYCVDNMPAEMIPQFAQLCLATKGRYEKVALVTDIRASMTFDALFQALQKLTICICNIRILYYIEASTAVIIKRYKETPPAPPG